MINEVKSEQEIIADIRNSLNYHSDQVNRFQSMLDAVEKKSGITTKKSHEATHSVPEIKTKRTYTKKVVPKQKQTFGEVIISILEEQNSPMLTRTLMEQYTEVTGKEFDRKNFSSRMSIEAKTKGIVQNKVFANNPNDTKYWWGLKQWFTPDHNIKPSYLEKIKDQIVI